MLALFALLMSSQAPKAPPTATLVSAGRAIAVQNCQSCHAIGRTGASPTPTAPRFRNLSAKYPIDSLSEAFAEGVLVGHSVMPEFEFAPRDVEALMAYIKSVQVRPKRGTNKAVKR